MLQDAGCFPKKPKQIQQHITVLSPTPSAGAQDVRIIDKKLYKGESI